MISLRALATISATLVWVETCFADCSSLRALAQQHANVLSGGVSLGAGKKIRPLSPRMQLSLAVSPAFVGMCIGELLKSAQSKTVLAQSGHANEQLIQHPCQSSSA